MAERGRTRWSLAVLTVLAAAFLGLGAHEAWHDAPTYDEPVMLVAGLTALTRQDLRLNPEHPPLAKALAALPALLAQPRIPDGPAWDRADDHAMTEAFVRENAEAGRLQRVVFLSRLVPLVLAAATGFALYLLGRSLFGPLAGTVAGAAWLTLPPVLGFGHVNGLDVPFTLATVLCVLAADRYLQGPSRRGAALVGAALAAALLIRTSGIVVLLAVLAVIAVAGRHRPRATLVASAVIVLVAVVGLWAGYRLLAPASPALDGGAAAVLPAEYRTGLERQQLDASDTRSFVLGRPQTGASLAFWPASLLVKVPATTMAFVLGGAVVAWGLRRDPRRVRIALVVLVGAALAAATVIGARPVGMRYLLPSVALALVAASALVEWARTRPRVLLGVGAGLAVQAGLLVGATPHSLSWVAVPGGDPWRVAADSDLEWGQDFYRLQDWSRGRHPWVAWSGPLPADLIPGARSLSGVDPRKVQGWVAVNATALTVHGRDELSWLRAYCPVDDLGGTVLLYRFDRPPDGATGPDVPPRRCAGDHSVRLDRMDPRRSGL